MKVFSLRMLLAGVLALGVAAMAAAGVRKPYDIDRVPDTAYRYPLVTAPLLTGPVPVIDGEVKALEWSGAAQTMPLIDRVTGAATQDQAICWIAYGQEGLYIAFRVERPAFAPRPAPLTSDGDGDFMAVYVRDKFGQRYGVGVQLDAYGNRREHDLGEVPERRNDARTWSGNSRLIDGGYEGELMLPWSLFERRMPRQDDVWELQVYNVRKTPSVQVGAYSVVDNRDPLADFGYLRFGGDDTPAIQLATLANDQTDELGARVSVPRGSSAQVTAHAGLFKPRRESVSFYETITQVAQPSPEEHALGRTVSPTLAGQETLRYYHYLAKWTEPVRGGEPALLKADLEPGKYLLHLRVLSHDKKLLAAGTWGLAQRVDLSVRSYLYPLLGRRLVVLADYTALDQAFRGQPRLSASLNDSNGQAVSELAVDANMRARENRLELPLRDVAPGPYTLTVRLNDARGSALATVERQVVVPPVPAWWGNTFGSPEELRQVPAPWTPMRSTSTSVDVWGRGIQLTNQLLPASITHTALGPGVNMLADPVRLIIQTSQDLAWGSHAVNREPWRVTHSADLNSLGGSLRGQLTVETEFDGFMKYRLVLSPVGRRPVPIAGLTLDIPLDRDLATHYHAGQFGTLLDSEEKPWQAGAVPAAGLTLPFTSSLWIGNRTAGLAVNMEWDRSWFPLDRQDAITLRFEDRKALLSIAMVQRDMSSGRQPRLMTISEPVAFEWSLLATPTKPMDTTWLRGFRLVAGETLVNRMSRRVDSGDTASLARAIVAEGATAHLTRDTSSADAKATVVWPREATVPGFATNDADAAWRLQGVRESISFRRRNGLRWVLFPMFGGVPDTWPELHPYWREMVAAPEGGSAGRFRFSPSRAYQDWYMSHLQTMIQQSQLNGLYQSSSLMPRLTASLADGSGWYDGAGRLRGRYPVFSLRRLQQRIWLALHRDGPHAGVVVSENFAYIYPAIESFTDVHQAGAFVGWPELLQSAPETLISRYYGRPFGVPVIAFNSNEYNQSATRLQSWGAALLLEAQLQAQPEHLLGDLYPNLARGTYDDAGAVIIERLWEIWQRFPWNEAQWLPYWTDAPMARLNNQEILAAGHLVPGREALLVLVNPTHDPVTATATLQLERLGFAAGTFTITDVVLQQPVAVSEGTRLSLSLEAGAWRYLRIAPAPAE